MRGALLCSLPGSRCYVFEARVGGEFLEFVNDVEWGVWESIAPVEVCDFEDDGVAGYYAAHVGDEVVGCEEGAAGCEHVVDEDDFFAGEVDTVAGEF